MAAADRDNLNKCYNVTDRSMPPVFFKRRVWYQITSTTGKRDVSSDSTTDEIPGSNYRVRSRLLTMNT